MVTSQKSEKVIVPTGSMPINNGIDYAIKQVFATLS
jgi:hypothetical protein